MARVYERAILHTNSSAFQTCTSRKHTEVCAGMLNALSHQVDTYCCIFEQSGASTLISKEQLNGAANHPCSEIIEQY